MWCIGKCILIAADLSTPTYCIVYGTHFQSVLTNAFATYETPRLKCNSNGFDVKVFAECMNGYIVSCAFHLCFESTHMISLVNGLALSASKHCQLRILHQCTRSMEDLAGNWCLHTALGKAEVLCDETIFEIFVYFQIWIKAF